MIFVTGQTARRDGQGLLPIDSECASIVVPLHATICFASCLLFHNADEGVGEWRLAILSRMNRLKNALQTMGMAFIRLI
ncbi:hypothetical protein ACFSHP_26775 [Novosphingobium panipatense]